MKYIYASILLIAGFSINAQNPTIVLDQIGSGFSSVTTLANCGDDRLFVVEQAGRIRFFNPYEAGASTLFLNIVSRVNDSGNERGLLGLAFPDDYKETGRFYVNYTASGGTTRISRFSVSEADSNAADPDSEEILLTINQPFSNHNGGNIMFGPDGYLYIGMGDGGSGGDPQNLAQNNQSLLGKMLRIDVSPETGYTIPSNNPFVGDASTLDEIWATGVRNPWKFSFDRVTGDLWIADVGQNAQEEVDFQPANSAGGENYGWRCYEGDLNYNTSGCAGSSNYVFPVFTFNHSSANGCSITGGFVYRGVFAADIYGRYFTTDYCSGRIWTILQEDENTFSNIDHGQYQTFAYTAFGEDAYGEMYLAEQGGDIFRIGTQNSDPIAVISESETNVCPGSSITLETQFNPTVSYVWLKDGQEINGATSSTLEVTETGSYTVRVSLEGDASATSEARVINLAVAPPILSITTSIDTLCDDAAFGPGFTTMPEGGTLSGIGVEDGVFNPFGLDPGTYTVSYNFITAEGCASEPASLDMTILPLPEVTIEGIDDIYCANIDIAVQPILTPAGGDFYGPGITNGLFSPSSADLGSNELFYTYADEFGCANTTSVITMVDECLGITSINTNLNVQPNPVKDILTVKLPDEINGEVYYTLYNTIGQEVEPLTRIATKSNSFNIQMNHIPTGIYFLKVQANEEYFVTEIIKN